MFLYLGSPRLLAELPQSPLSPAVVRRRQRVLVIDDEPFYLNEVLSTHGFSIQEMRDLPSIDLAAAYPIIVCDIRDVGAHLGAKHQGAHLFREIRRAFPEKYIIAFSGFRFDPTYNEYFRSADVSLKKDTDTEAWVRVLDEAIAVMADPKQRWLRLRRYLLEEVKLELWTILMLEQAFIRAVESRNKEDLTERLDSLRLSHETRKLLTSFASSLFSDVLAEFLSAAVTA